MKFTDHLDPTLFDSSTSAATDFYRHVNGGWLDANPVPVEYPAWGATFEVHVRNEEILKDLLEEAAAQAGPEGSPARMVGDYFAAGMEEDVIAAAGIDPLRPHMEAIAAIDSIEALRSVLPGLRRIGVGAFHSIGVSPDFEDADRYLVYLGQGGLGLPERDYYLRDDDRSKEMLSAYVDHVTSQLGNLGAGGREEAESILALERRLAESSLPAEKARDLSLTLNRHDVDGLNQLMPAFDLVAYVRGLGVGSESLNIDHAAFFESLDETLQATPVETIRAYLTWHLVRAYAAALPPAFEDEAFDFYNRRLGGQQQPRERWTRVLAAAGGDIGEQVARLYVEAAFSAGAKERCEELVDGLLKAMGRSIESRAWMTEPTKEAALQKLSSFKYKIGYPDRWRDYSGLLIARDSHVDNRMRCAAFEWQRKFGRLDEPVDKAEWEMPAHVVNAYYNPLHNEIVFPAGILQPPFFYPDADDAVNYGAIGTVIGHEITHGFDDNGSRFDDAGRKRNWWTDEDRAEFEGLTEQLVEQFSGFEVSEDQKVNGRLTLGENIADLGGLKIAYDAFTATLDGAGGGMGGYTPQQRFFLSYGTIWRMNYTPEYLRMVTNVDVHSPNHFRVNGPLANFQAFAEAFDVSEGPMRREAGAIIEIW